MILLVFSRYGDEVIAAVRSLPFNLELGPGRDRSRRLQLCLARIFNDRLWRLFDFVHGFRQGVPQSLCIAGRQKETSGLIDSVAGLVLPS